jgi:ComF family protein
MLCAACESDARIDLSAACARCAIPLPGDVRVKLCGRCLRRPPAFDKTIAAALYDAPLFARLLHNRITDAVLADVDVVLPVPLSRGRMATRGFNQAIEIARPLAQRLGRPLDTESVLRIADTAPQASLPFDARRRNVRGAFAVIDARRERIIGRRIGVVDDVMTTGATLEELAKTLKRAGAVAVVNLVVARTP